MQRALRGDMILLRLAATIACLIALAASAAPRHAYLLPHNDNTGESDAAANR